jgi:hypothetical protein
MGQALVVLNIGVMVNFQHPQFVQQRKMFLEINSEMVFRFYTDGPKPGKIGRREERVDGGPLHLFELCARQVEYDGL